MDKRRVLPGNIKYHLLDAIIIILAIRTAIDQKWPTTGYWPTTGLTPVPPQTDISIGTSTGPYFAQVSLGDAAIFSKFECVVGIGAFI